MGYIYKITNKINGDKYIGQTSSSISYRWEQHKKRARNELQRNEHFINAIRKYGEENFTIELIEECPNELLSEREKYWIKKYNTFHGAGYNSTEGGEGSRLYDRNKILELWNNNLNISDVAKRMGSSCPTISNILQKELNISNEEILKRKHQTVGEKTRKSIEQYDLDGKLINKYSCAQEVENKLGFNAKMIAAACRKGSVSNNFYWKYCEDTKLIEDKIKTYLLNRNKALKKSVKQYDLEGNFIAEYVSQVEAEEKTKISRIQISRVCLGKDLTAGGYIWCFSDDCKNIEEYVSFIKNKTDPRGIEIKQYDITGKYIASFSSITDAAKAVDSDKTAIQKAVKNHYTSNNYIWILPGEEDLIPKIIKRHNTKHDSKKKIVYQYDKNGVFLKAYPCATDACIAMNIDPKKHKSLSRNCQGYQKTFNGYIWSYEAPNSLK